MLNFNAKLKFLTISRIIESSPFNVNTRPLSFNPNHDSLHRLRYCISIKTLNFSYPFFRHFQLYSIFLSIIICIIIIGSWSSSSSSSISTSITSSTSSNNISPSFLLLLPYTHITIVSTSCSHWVFTSTGWLGGLS